MNVYVQKNDNQKSEACIKNNIGEFFVTLGANGRIYIGFFNAQNDEIKDVDFFISNEDELLYDIFDKFYNLTHKTLNNNEDLKQTILTENDILLLSEDFSEDMASKFKVSKEENGYRLTFSKSKSNVEMNSFFVSIKRSDSKYYPINNIVRELYSDLISYEILDKQVIIDDIVPTQSGNIRRVRKIASK